MLNDFINNLDDYNEFISDVTKFTPMGYELGYDWSRHYLGLRDMYGDYDYNHRVLQEKPVLDYYAVFSFQDFKNILGI